MDFHARPLLLINLNHTFSLGSYTQRQDSAQQVYRFYYPY